ncbi:MAG: transcription elongation factor GreA [Candidatus Portnoybacteria bacterium CG10_big_fil_rev_8_21_14_0_10_36_7]|uniref:Transcription elongation factor GreA n=1 Tax=Candidatus Portnoybacteria bacterium CG10_big_fil_rev_8_21_14_0_10_36_7 TaxID=1974812 RepID=A0A2M8KE18_9BACT|nr:MAG: transcription elongation factor GreA [Candidatus Portnoybacteria bacterium CG10_big_fil_rev_8_21_14_0_10_36_7]
MNPRYISLEGLEQLKTEVENYKMKRQEIAKRLEEAKSLGDLSENTEYMQAREAQSFNEGKIQDLENIIKEAVVIDKSTTQKGIVQVGSTVKFIVNGEREVVYMIVGSEESNPLEGKVSNSSPIGQACLGKKKGESFEVQTPQKRVKYKIVDIS